MKIVLSAASSVHHLYISKANVSVEHAGEKSESTPASWKCVSLPCRPKKHTLKGGHRCLMSTPVGDLRASI